MAHFLANFKKFCDVYIYKDDDIKHYIIRRNMF
jgi:hypothetical protein